MTIKHITAIQLYTVIPIYTIHVPPLEPSPQPPCVCVCVPYMYVDRYVLFPLNAEKVHKLE